MTYICSFFSEVGSFVLGLGGLLRWKVRSFFILALNFSVRMKWIEPLFMALRLR